jgi:hypothetical protein
MPTIAQVEEQIYTCEGFRVRMSPLNVTTKTIPAYDFLVMAPQRWRLSDWKMVRLSSYVPFVREIVVLRGDEKPAKSDLQLGSLRDSYYQAKYGSLTPEAAELPTVAEFHPRPDSGETETPPKAPAPPRRRTR